MPRLANLNVLTEAIRTGVNSPEYFAIASVFGNTRYIDLKFNQYVGIIENSACLVKVDVAQKQLAEDAEKQADLKGDATDLAGTSDYAGKSPTDDIAVLKDNKTPETPKNKRFFMSADLDNTRINRDVQRFVEEVIQHLTSADGVEVTVSLEVVAESRKGFSQDTVRTISENCRTLKVKSSGFEE